MFRNIRLMFALAICMALAVVGTPGGSAASGSEGGLQRSAADLPSDGLAGLLFEETAGSGALDVYLDAKTGGPVLVVERDSSEEVRALVDRIGGGQPKIEEAALTRAELGDIMKALEEFASDPSIKKGGGLTFGFDAPTGRVVLEADVPRETFSDVLNKFDGLVDFRRVEMSISDLSRENDIQPYWGGVRISVEPNWNDAPCSSGFAAKASTGTKYMVSASHCFDAPFQTVLQPLGKVEGTVQAMTNPLNDHKDIALVGGKTYAGVIYTSSDANNAGPSKEIGGAGNPIVNSQYCYSGAKTFNHCGHTAQNNGVVNCNGAGVCLHNMTRLTGGSVPGPGDSGGPVYIVSASTGLAHIRGTIIRRNDITGEVYIHVWSTIRDTYDLTIVLG